MRIAMIGPFGLAPKGTMRARALPLARELAARGHAVCMVMPPWHTPEGPPRAWDDAGVRLEYVALSPRIPGLHHLAVSARLLRRALAWRPDVIHCFKPKAYAGLAAWLAWGLRRWGRYRGRLVVDEDDWEGAGGWNDLEPYSPALRRVFAWQERWGLTHADAITVASRTLQSLAWSLGAPRERVHYLPNGTTAAQPGDGAAARARYGLGGAPVVLLYTRFFEFDVARAVHVFRRVVDQAPEARLLVVGAALYAEQDARFDRLVAEAGLSAQVVRTGWLPPEDLPDCFAAADVALHLFDDTLVNRCKCSAKLVDLLAAGVPVVADAVGQNTEYIKSGETGLLATGEDTECMCSGALSLLRNPVWGRSLGAAAAEEMATRFAWRVLAEAALRAYGVSPSPYSPGSSGGISACGSGSRASR